jgi:D-glucuronyl C5-epimerase-like protein
MALAALPALSAATLALAANAAPLQAAPPQPPRAPAPVVSRAPAHTVTAAIDRAERLGAISGGRAVVYRRGWHDAVRAAKRIGGPRGAVVRQAVTSTQRLAREGALRSGRLGAALAGVHASAEVARSRRALPAPGGRVRLAGDSTVYSYRPPFGMQVHPLGTIGKLNALATTCTDVGHRRGWRCRRRTLTAAADRLIALSVPAGRTLRFEYLFAFGGGRPGWVSAMTQATGAQALARTAAITGERRYAAAARAAYRALTRPVPRGAAVRDGQGRIAHLAMYAFRPRMRVLNGEEQALIGIADFARITHDRVAARVARRGARELATRLPAFDTGAWTLYDLGGAEADLNYHRLAARFAQGVCTRALARGFCPAAARFARYTKEPPRLALDAPATVRAPRRIAIALGASKRADAHLVVRDGRGRVALDRRLVLGRAIGRIVMPVRRAGTYTVSLGATALNGRRSVRSVRVVVLKPKPKPKPRKAKQAAKAKHGARATGSLGAKDQGSAKRTKPGS